MNKKTITYIALLFGAYYLYNYYNKKKPVVTVPDMPPVTNIETVSQVLPYNVPVKNIVTDMMEVTKQPKKETYQTFYGETINGVNVIKTPMIC
jgi:hypothetical protein